MQQQKLRLSPPVLLTWADTPVRHSPPEPAGPVCPRRAPGRHCEMNAENSNVAVGTGTPGAAEPPYVGSGRAVWPWVNWGLALTTVSAAAIVMLFALGAVMSTDGCSDRSCPNRGGNRLRRRVLRCARGGLRRPRHLFFHCEAPWGHGGSAVWVGAAGRRRRVDGGDRIRLTCQRGGEKPPLSSGQVAGCAGPGCGCHRGHDGAPDAVDPGGRGVAGMAGRSRPSSRRCRSARTAASTSSGGAPGGGGGAIRDTTSPAIR